MLNSIVAQRYTVETVPGALTGTIELLPDYDDIAVYRVHFTFADDPAPHSMDVWEEPDGTLYGEW